MIPICSRWVDSIKTLPYTPSSQPLTGVYGSVAVLVQCTPVCWGLHEPIAISLVAYHRAHTAI